MNCSQEIKSKVNNNIWNHITIPLFILLFGLSCITGCGKGEDSKKIVITAGFSPNEVFRLENKSCSEAQMRVYLTNIQNQYENVYGSRIWEAKVNGTTLEENVKDMALSKMAQIKAINLLAEDRGIELDEAENEKVESAAAEYYGSLNESEKEAMGVDQDVIRELYKEYAVSEKLYEDIIKDINPEISDDEARTITVEHILIKTYYLDEDGVMHKYTENAGNEAKALAQEICERAKNGEDFENLASEYNEDSHMTYSFGKGEMDAVFENAAFNLGENEISDVVQTEYGYHVIKCISTFNREVTDANKHKIVEERRNKAFSDVYDDYVEGLTKNLNEELWGSIRFIHDSNVTTCDFFEVFDRVWND